MITNMWKITNLYCGHHDTPVKMELEQRGKTLSYFCKDEHCKCQISLKDFEKMLNYISDLIYNAEISNEVLYLKGYKWKTKTLEYEILEHGNEIAVKVINRELLHKNK